MRIILVRHGETDYNVKGLVQGQRQTKLTKNGVRQAKALAVRLKDEKIDSIFTSKLARAIETARIVDEFHGLEINTTEELNERGCGVWEGGKGGLIRKQFGYDVLEDVGFKPEGAESWSEVERRVVSFIESLIERHGDKTVLVVGHKGFNRLLINFFLRKPLENHDKIKQGPACVNIIEIENNIVRVKSINDMGHLDGVEVIREENVL